MRRVAVVGGGIAGIAAAYRLCRDSDVTVFERAADLGGEARTITVEEDGAPLRIDLGVFAFQEALYPTFTAFLAELGVATRAYWERPCFFDADTGEAYVPDDYSFVDGAVSEQIPGNGRAEFTILHAQAHRFRENGAADPALAEPDVSLGEYVARTGLGPDFRHSWVVQLASAQWTLPPSTVLRLPARSVLRLMTEDGPGSAVLPWRTVESGTSGYLRRARAALEARGCHIRTRAAVTGVAERPDGVRVRTQDSVEHFDHVIIAAHADEALSLVERPTALQRKLASVPYQPCTMLLHRDPVVMAPDRSHWRTSNFGRTRRFGDLRTWHTTYVNHTQGLRARRDYFRTPHSPLPIRDELVVAETLFRHPVFTVEALRLQDEITALNTEGRVRFAGAYVQTAPLGPDGLGLHEAAFASGVAAAETLLVHDEPVPEVPR
ncbi:FAD-dependent oxidoreductase [Streptoalloteichus hindustanus]|uniref:Predicted NAD/FAD-binding protein n=1 Tax=Streptoalloteichus hindustanus TaxID=2017 RepID=A0A1M5CGS9_STRHI|nr:FAD-dependent oxidoreductase [Streptoalloteichus hindustanus]SHF53881.1 Predicted NAD/FAD-binding protein [Streptoalloteichus hindustanus]